MAKQIFVTGHKSPDTDSICSSIAYAKLKQLQGIDATPIRAGEPNKETAFALDYFHVAPQPLVKDFYVKVSEAVRKYIVSIADATRHSDKVKLGVSPRGTLALMRASQAKAAASGRDYVLPDDVKAVALDVLGHRIICKGFSISQSTSAPAEVLGVILNQLPVVPLLKS